MSNPVKERRGKVRKSIRQLREERGLSQMELASALKVQAVSVYNWERGKHHPDALRLRAIANLFEVKMDDIALVGVDVDREGAPLDSAGSGTDEETA